jgi:hypothetical protein
VRFCGQKDSAQRIFITKCFLFMVGSVWRVKRFVTRSRNSLKGVRKPQVMSDQVALVQKWLRQHSKDFYAAGFDALVKRWDKFISMLVEDMSRNKSFSHVPISHVLRFISICVLFTDSSSYYIMTHSPESRQSEQGKPLKGKVSVWAKEAR